MPQIILAALIVVAAISVVVVYFGGSDDPAPQVAVETTAPGPVVDCTDDDGEPLSAEDCAAKLPLTNETSKVASLADETAKDEAAEAAEDAPPAPSAEEMTEAEEKKKAAVDETAGAAKVAEKKRKKAAEKKAAARKADEKKAAERKVAEAKEAAEDKKAAEKNSAKAKKAEDEKAAKAAQAEDEKAAKKQAAAKKTEDKKAASKKTTEKKTAEKKTAGKSKLRAAAREAGEVFVEKRSDRDVTSIGETKPFTALVPGRYVVIGSFDSVANAQILQERYRNWGAILVPVKLNGEPRQRVVIGPFSRAQLKGELSRVAETGVKGAWAMAVRLSDVARKQ